MNDSELIELIQKYNKGTCTEVEKSLLESWYIEFELNGIPDLTEAQIAEINSSIPIVIAHKNKVGLWPRIVAAASIVICIGIGFYFYNYNTTTPIVHSQHDIAPGGNKAFLTLADGKRITLTDAKNGELAEQSGVKITKAADGQLIYAVSNLPNETNSIKEYNIIETPNGGQYQVKLPDGTKVWLNAASALKFPSSFTRLVNRRVELLRGEAYFEVAKDKKHPFIVRTNQQEVKVLGTHFNIDAYERSAKTTLLEGSIRVNLLSPGIRGQSMMIKPGQQLRIINYRPSIVNDIDVEDVVSWKNGYFKFNENLEGIMNKLSRWYNVEIVFETKPDPKRILNGEISRNRDLAEVLDMLRYTGNINFKIEGRRVMVTD